LFYRLDAVEVDLPPLRERKEDIPALVNYLLAKHSPWGRLVRCSVRKLGRL
jgi:transcriptional regulator with PAS, ATPase and Fis domain